jgi:hypothetical protein
MLSMTLISERALVCVVSITYDRDVAGEDDRANVCLQELLARFVTRGYMPYRLGIQSMGLSRPEGVPGQILDEFQLQPPPFPPPDQMESWLIAELNGTSLRKQVFPAWIARDFRMTGDQN